MIRKEIAKPIVDDAIDHEMNAFVDSMILDAVIEIEVEIPRLALGHLDPVAIEIELDTRTRLDRDMDTGKAVLDA